MTPATLQREAEIEKAVLRAAERGEDYKPSDLVRRVVAIRVGGEWAEDLIIQAIWRLISEKRLILSNERTLRKP